MAYGRYPTILAVNKKGCETVNGIDTVANDGTATVSGIYTIGGIKVQTLQKGINIIKMTDGTTRKVLVK